jgi:hypothetical protein
MACHRVATDSHAEKSGRGAGGAGAAGGRVVSGAAAFACERADVRDVQRPALDNCMRIRCAAGAEGARRAARLTNFSPFILYLI